MEAGITLGTETGQRRFSRSEAGTGRMAIAVTAMAAHIYDLPAGTSGVNKPRVSRRAPFGSWFSFSCPVSSNKLPKLFCLQPSPSPINPDLPETPWMASAPFSQQPTPCEGLGRCEELSHHGKPLSGKALLTGSGCSGEQDKQEVGR